VKDLLDSWHQNLENVLRASRCEDESPAKFFHVLGVELVNVDDHILLYEVE